MMIYNENVKITQIFPQKYLRNNIFIESVCLKIEKIITGSIIKFLNDLIKLGKVIVSKKHFLKKDHLEYTHGSLIKLKDYHFLNEDYYLIDITYLKRVKSFDDKFNLVLISSKDVINHL